MKIEKTLERNGEIVKKSNKFCVNSNFFKVFLVNFLSFDKKPLFSLEKTYKDFKLLHKKVDFYEFLKEIVEKLEILAKNRGVSLEKLPNKGNFFDFRTKNCENKVIEFRKFALAVYLKYLSNNDDFKESPQFLSFLKP